MYYHSIFIPLVKEAERFLKELRRITRDVDLAQMTRETTRQNTRVECDTGTTPREMGGESGYVEINGERRYIKE